jgi:hypothetical protein
MKVENIGNLVTIIRNSYFEEGIHFFTKDSDYQQVALWEYNKDKELKAHTHLLCKKLVERTQEVIHIIEGKIIVDIYDDEGNLVDSTILFKGDTMITLNGGHGYKVLDDSTKVLEIKNGPYLGRDNDRKDI